MIEHIWFAVKVVVGFVFVVSTIVCISAVILDYRQRKHQRRWKLDDPSPNCERRYVP